MSQAACQQSAGQRQCPVPAEEITVAATASPPGHWVPTSGWLLLLGCSTARPGTDGPDNTLQQRQRRGTADTGDHGGGLKLTPKMGVQNTRAWGAG